MLSRRKLFGFLAAAPVGAMAAAKGALAYADGGTVLARGTYGLVGERGGEDIMPLRRMPDGKFGIGREIRSVVTVRSPS